MSDVPAIIGTAVIGQSRVGIVALSPVSISGAIAGSSSLAAETTFSYRGETTAAGTSEATATTTTGTTLTASGDVLGLSTAAANNLIALTTMGHLAHS